MTGEYGPNYEARQMHVSAKPGDETNFVAEDLTNIITIPFKNLPKNPYQLLVLTSATSFRLDLRQVALSREDVNERDPKRIHRYRIRRVKRVKHVGCEYALRYLSTKRQLIVTRRIRQN